MRRGPVWLVLLALAGIAACQISSAAAENDNAGGDDNADKLNVFHERLSPGDRLLAWPEHEWASTSLLPPSYVAIQNGENLRFIHAPTLMSALGSWKTTLPTSAPYRIVGFTRECFLISDGFEVRALSTAKGDTLWHYGSRPDGLLDPSVDPEDTPRWRHVVSSLERVFAIRGDGRAVLLNMSDGKVLHRQTLDNIPAIPPVLPFSTGQVVVLRHSATAKAISLRPSEPSSPIHFLEVPINTSVRQLSSGTFRSCILLTYDQLLAFDLGQTSAVWKFDVSRTEFFVEENTDTDSHVYLANHGLRVLCVDAVKDHAAWESPPVLRLGEQMRQVLPLPRRVLVRGDHTLAILDRVTGIPMKSLDAGEDCQWEGCWAWCDSVVVARSSGDSEVEFYELVREDGRLALKTPALLRVSSHARVVRALANLVIQDESRLHSINNAQVHTFPKPAWMKKQ